MASPPRKRDEREMDDEWSEWRVQAGVQHPESTHKTETMMIKKKTPSQMLSPQSCQISQMRELSLVNSVCACACACACARACVNECMCGCVCVGLCDAEPSAVFYEYGPLVPA